jgi:hypothetical protein
MQTLSFNHVRSAMRLMSVPLALLLALAFVADTNGGVNGKKKQHAIHGKVEAVTKDKDKDSGTLTVEIHHKKKGTATVEVKHEKFKVTPDTKFEIARRDSAGAVQRKPATFADVKVGEHVAVVPMEGARGVAQRVEILIGKKGSKPGVNPNTAPKPVPNPAPNPIK